MLEKLLSLVPYNPGLTHQLAFYSRRMREEASIRRTGLAFVVLAFVVQSVAVISPPQSAVAGSSNDLINGGFSTKAEARQDCENDTQGYQRILHYYGISCSAFDANDANVVYIESTGQNYYSAGHNPTGDASETSAIHIDGARDIYFRHLSVWGSPQGGWKTIRLRNQDGKVFYAMYECGNIVSVGVPTPSPLKPEAKTTPTPAPKVTPVTKPTPTPQPTPTPTPTPQPTPQPHPTPCPYNSAIAADSALCYKPCEFNGSIPATDSACKPCSKSSNKTDTLACVSVHKTAANVTAGIADANNTTANAGDVITYTLYAQNTGQAPIDNFTFQENMNDVLDYANVVDTHGGLLSSVDNVIAWPTMTLPAGQTANVQVTVKVKDPIPQTPVSSSDPAHFDLIMTNVYGNAVNIKLPASPVKSVQMASTTLPNTGPGTTLFIAATIVIIAGYFYGRASLLARESDIAVKETATL